MIVDKILRDSWIETKEIGQLLRCLSKKELIVLDIPQSLEFMGKINQKEVYY